MSIIMDNSTFSSENKFQSNEIECISTENNHKLSLAVEARNVEFSYNVINSIRTILANPREFQWKFAPVLRKISISVPQGGIYALLGSSGCGKTTLLKCILGRIQPKSGSIKIFGQKPGSKHCSVPGAGVGYMPQELALFPEFNIRETLQYFGQLYAMSHKEIKSQSKYMINFLQLPESSRLIKQLSGGQQRRVSLCCALIHKPPLMILDEPTVGVDPLLRSAIWSHLEKLCAENGITVILTTHYIEEARTARNIGLMRYGALLVESNPDVLLAQHDLPRLEDVFFKLCVIQDKEKDSRENSDAHLAAEIQQDEPNDSVDDVQEEIEPQNQTAARKSAAFFDTYRFQALLTKNQIRLRRNIAITIFYCLLPALQYAIFIISSGKTPRNVPLAVYNEEQPAELSGKFLSYFQPGSTIQLHTDSLRDAERAVCDGKAWAALHFHSNFSTALDERRELMAQADNDTIIASNIHLYLDMSNQIIGFSVLQNIFLSFQSLMQHFLGSLGYNPAVLSTPISITEVIYGTLDPTSFTELIMPGIVILIVFFTTSIVTRLLLILEQKDGVLERSLVAGVKPFECIFSHLITQTIVMIFQQILLFGTIFYIFDISSRGSLLLIFLICVLQGIAGIMFGLFVSLLFPDQISSGIVVMGALVPALMLSGIFWPVQYISKWLFWISNILPQTHAMEAFRSILVRGWAFEHSEIMMGFVSTGYWIVIFLVLTCFVFSKFV